MKTTISWTLLILSFNMGFGQSNLEKFKSISKTNDTAKLNDFLTGWKKTGINDPDLYTSCINYYYKKSKQDIAYINKKQEGNSSLRITDSTGAIAGYLNFNRELNPAYLDSVFVYASEGI